MKVFADVAAEFVPAVERVFGERPRVLDGSRAVLIGAGGRAAAEAPAAGRSLLKLQLEAGEHELWLIECHGALEQRLGYVRVRASIEDALQAARRLALEHVGEPARKGERTREMGPGSAPNFPQGGRQAGPGSVTDRPQPRRGGA